MAQAVRLLTYISEVPGSNLGRTKVILVEVYVGFLDRSMQISNTSN
jgi:hypothetical protein